MSKKICRLVLACMVGLGTAAVVDAHPDDPKQFNIAPRYEGPGYRAGQEGVAGSNFDAQDMLLQALVTIPEFGAHSFANDCWGYVSPSGREYAIIGLSHGTGFVEITDPANPAIVGVVPGPSGGTWRDIKVYQHHAYAVSEDGGGIQVIPMTDIDNGNLGAVTEVTTGGVLGSHNVVINEDSGFLYRCGGATGLGIRAYDLSNPALPVWAATWTDRYVHDAQVVSYVGGPYDGREIAFLCAGGSNGSVNTGLTILDVTDKQNMFEVAPHFMYPNNQYSHQGWLSEDRQYFYLGDELDEPNVGVESTMHIIDVSTLESPSLASTFTNGLPAITHNLYVKGDMIYAANYSTGIRVFDISSPLAPTEVAHFDTVPEHDSVNFDGLWSNYPYYPSGTIIGSDRQRGLFVWAEGQIPLAFSYPNGLPTLMDPAGVTVDVQISELTLDTIEPNSATLHYDTGSGFVDVPLTGGGGGLFTATFPSLPCGAGVKYYFSASAGGITVKDPATAPDTTHEALAAAPSLVALNDDFETDQGWTTSVQGASSGFWQRGVPVDDPGWTYDPATDGDGSGQCWLTQNEAGNTDVDGGAVTLLSPVLDMSGGDLVIAYTYFLTITNVDGSDMLLVELSSNGAAGPFTEITRHDTSGNNTWRQHQITQAEIEAAGVVPGTNMTLRFTANDADTQSIVEAGLDGLYLLACDGGVLGDLDGDGIVGINDFLMLLGDWGPCGDCGNCAADLDNDCTVGINDFLMLLANWT